MRLIVGLQPVREAIRAHGSALHRVVVEGGGPPAPQVEAIARFARDQGVEVFTVSRSEIDKATKGAYHQGALAYAPELPLVPLSALSEHPSPLIIALDELQDPQNFGAVVRSSVALGASAVVWPEHRSAPLSPATFRASAGAIEHATLCRVASLPHALRELAEGGMQVIGLDANGDHLLENVDLGEPTVLVLGAEGKGLRKTVKSACTSLARLPMRGPLGSLNASVAVAIAIYEADRQRRAASLLEGAEQA